MAAFAGSGTKDNRIDYRYDICHHFAVYRGIAWAGRNPDFLDWRGNTRDGISLGRQIARLLLAPDISVVGSLSQTPNIR